jgi:hypothetical protein
MTRWVILAAASFAAAFAAAAPLPCSGWTSQDSASSPSPEQQSPAVAPSPVEPKKTKKVWTNDNLGAVSASPISQLGNAQEPASSKGAAAKPASSGELAAFRKQLAALQTQLAGVEKQISDLQNFSKGQASGASGMQLHKGYSTEPIDDQLRKLQGKRRSLAAQLDAVLDAARKRGVEPGQLR